MALQEHLALVERGSSEALARLRESDVTAFDLGEAQHLKRLRHREEIVHLHVQRRSDRGQGRGPVIERSPNCFTEAHQEVFYSPAP